MPKTNGEVIAQALSMIEVTPVGDTPSGEDYAEALVHLEDVLSAIDLRHQVGVEIPNNAIPDEFFLPIAKMVAGSVATVYSKPQYVSFYRAGLRNLRAQAAHESKVDGRSVQTSYF